MVSATLTAPETTARFARLLAGLLHAPAVVTLQGDLGTGKTTLVRGVLRALGVAGEVTSPSFTLAQSYSGDRGLVLHHLDLYRLGPGADVELFAWDDYLSDDAIVFIEWPEAGAAELPPADVAVRLLHDRPTSRGLRVAAAPAVEQTLAAALREAGADDVRIDVDPGDDPLDAGGVHECGPRQ
jgi:tRNA threonylcarbamoyladenosine biosynthesis protein TsaE